MTKHQKEKLDSILSSDDKVVAFWGEAGTGKTHSISKFIQSLSNADSVKLCSTTHQSLAVLRDIVPEEHECSIDMSTIHSHLGFRVTNNYGKSGLMKTNKIPDSCTYLIIDEAFYLTGQLTDYLNSEECLNTVHKKIILVGDRMQLTIDPFLDLSGVPSAELTDNMRQVEGSTLHDYCRNVRKIIEFGGDPIPIPESHDMTVTYNHADFIDKYKKCTSSKSIIAFLNSTVKSYNINIKKKMLKADIFSVDDQLIVMAPVIGKTMGGEQYTVFNNRERVTVTEVVDIDDKKWLKKAGFIGTMDENFIKDVKANVKILRVIKGSKEAYIKVPNTKAWMNKYLDIFKANALKSGSWKPFYDFKDGYNMVHHSYAMTVFSAQGSTFSEVFIDLSDFNPPKDPTREKLYRMVYVAMTRAKVKATVYLGAGPRDYESFGKNNEPQT